MFLMRGPEYVSEHLIPLISLHFVGVVDIVEMHGKGHRRMGAG